MGRTPQPLEVKRRTGRAAGRDSGGRPLPAVANVTSLRMATGTPEPPTDFGLDGTALWNRAWAAAVTWLSPDSDRDALEHACRLADNLATARRRYSATTDPADARAVVAFSGEFTKALSRLGFDPAARSQLGVAEVKAQSTLEKMIASRNA